MSDPSSGTDRSGYAGQWSPSAGATSFNAISFLIAQALGGMSIAKLVKVVACTNAGGVSPNGTVDVIPMVNLLDGQGNASQHGTVYKLPYFRMQGGKNAIIMDPQKDDIGLAVISDRDISVVKRTKKQANPGSYRRFDLADGLYIGGFLNATPEQYVRFVLDGDGNPIGITVTDKNGNTAVMNSDGISLTDKNSNTIVMNSDGIAINGVLFDRSQNVSAVADLTTTGANSLGGGAQAVKLADGSSATKVTAT